MRQDDEAARIDPTTEQQAPIERRVGKNTDAADPKAGALEGRTAPAIRPMRRLGLASLPAR